MNIFNIDKMLDNGKTPDEIRALLNGELAAREEKAKSNKEVEIARYKAAEATANYYVAMKVIEEDEKKDMIDSFIKSFKCCEQNLKDSRRFAELLREIEL